MSHRVSVRAGLLAALLFGRRSRSEVNGRSLEGPDSRELERFKGFFGWFLQAQATEE